MRHTPLLLTVFLAAVPLSAHAQGILDPQGPVAAGERQILFNSLGIMLAIVIPTIVAILAVGFWYRASNSRARYLPDFNHSDRLEVLVWSIPLMTVLLVGGVAWLGAHELDPRKALPSSVKPVTVQVVSLDWKWLFIYPEEGIASVNHLTIPVGRPVSFELTSAGVMNSFFVPQLGGQIYTMSGMLTRLQLQADHAGIYRGMSAQFSGDGFADMHFDVDAVEAGNFAQWVETARSKGSSLDASTYAHLTKRSAGIAPVTYRAVTPGLFDGILAAEIQHEDICTRTSMRAER
ncbi:ubiquinol oxidase subunit II [Mesorhizobium sangaii]|uniref:Ubiquinol oxidase subunit 2 n=1 Tax=Mesorhizobium sangaii TaxID=505389 RepID=A0A841P1T1_9HYPH|nr:ubiquinol oxidase subunit II [Mesorhizobium sangaii]MBB6409217.1 cytochrome o ubiquinol oxidase subunit 2 [Mesorhizobium sangaii]